MTQETLHNNAVGGRATMTEQQLYKYWCETINNFGRCLTPQEKDFLDNVTEMVNNCIMPSAKQVKWLVAILCRRVAEENLKGVKDFTDSATKLERLIQRVDSASIKMHQAMIDVIYAIADENKSEEDWRFLELARLDLNKGIYLSEEQAETLRRIYTFYTC